MGASIFPFTADEGDVNIVWKVCERENGIQSADRNKHEAGTAHFHKEGTLKKPCLDVFGVAILPFI